MSPLWFVAGLLLIFWSLWDAFETILLPRRVPARLRLSRFVIRWLWKVWSAIARRIEHRARRENFLSLYALLSVLGLLVVWAVCLIVGFALLHYADGSQLVGGGAAPGFAVDLYMSGTTFFTLGLGDVHPSSTIARVITVTESGTGFGFLALVLAYVPVLYQSFSRREARITLLDAWAGSPPTAAVLLRRCFESRSPEVVVPLLKEWEAGCADMLESHLSYPILCFFRSQHDNQSWLGSLVAVLDTCALIIVGVDDIDPFQARLTFAIARHVLVDLSQTFRLEPELDPRAGHDPAELATFRQWLADAGVELKQGPEADAKLAGLRALYLPFARPFSRFLFMALPPWLPPPRARYNWETTAWAKTSSDEGH